MQNRTDTSDFTVTLHPVLQQYLESIETSTAGKKPVHRKEPADMKTVFPLKTHSEIIAMSNWLYQHRDKKLLLAFTLGINLGLRANELLQLRYSDVFAPNGEVRFSFDLLDTSDAIHVWQSKTSKYRTVFLNEACKETLEWFFPVRDSSLYSDNYLFPSRKKNVTAHLKVDSLRVALKEAAIACGIQQNFGTHSLRKTWGWHVYMWMKQTGRNVDISILQRAFGHSSPATTLRYLGIEEVEEKEVYRTITLRTVTDPDFLGSQSQMSLF